MLDSGTPLKFQPAFNEHYKKVKSENWQWQPSKSMKDEDLDKTAKFADLNELMTTWMRHEA